MDKEQFVSGYVAGLEHNRIVGAYTRSPEAQVGLGTVLARQPPEPFLVGKLMAMSHGQCLTIDEGSLNQTEESPAPLWVNAFGASMELTGDELNDPDAVYRINGDDEGVDEGEEVFRKALGEVTDAAD